MSGRNSAGSWDPRLVRDLLVQALPNETPPSGVTLDPRCVYLPASHVKALHPNTMVVVGMPGAGKTFWWSALQDAGIRSLVAGVSPRVEVREQTRVEVGFGERPDPEAYPDPGVLRELLRRGAEPRLIWRTVVVHKLAPQAHPIRQPRDWSGRLAWVAENPEPVRLLLDQCDRTLEQQQTWCLVLFDALDRSADNWQDVNRLVRGLLQAALEFRSYRRLRLKCFLRSDQIDQRHVADFPDAAKVLSWKIELSWPRSDLYGLLWQYLANAWHPGAKAFREVAAAQNRVTWAEIRCGQLDVCYLSPDASYDEAVQRDLFHAIAGKWMGRDPRRGSPYTWVPSHLADGWGRTSPRSFLAALRAAAEDTAGRYPEHRAALHHESIARGVRTASQTRVREVKQDYPWVDWLMQPLTGLAVPCPFEAVVERWEQARALEGIRERVEAGAERLPPAHLEDGPEGVREDLEELGVFVRMSDGRVNIPEVFRVGYGLGRRGGVRPIRTGEGA